MYELSSLGLITSFAELPNLTLSEVSRSTPISSNAISALKERQNGICHISGESQDLQPIHIVSPSVLHDDDLIPGVRSFLYTHKGPSHNGI